jgi:hypothetical protein
LAGQVFDFGEVNAAHARPIVREGELKAHCRIEPDQIRFAIEQPHGHLRSIRGSAGVFHKPRGPREVVPERGAKRFLVAILGSVDVRQVEPAPLIDA